MKAQFLHSPASLFVEPAGDISVSFEFFPPKTEVMEQHLWQSITELAPLQPGFVSVTYGAGGSTRARTHATVARIIRETGLEVAAHLNCVDASRDEVDAVAADYWQAGVRHIVALRGDPALKGVGFTPHPDGYQGSVELVAGLRAVADFDISVACYPEPHPDSRGVEADIEHLKRKFDAGASRAISQFFFEPELFLRYVDRLRKAGITAPIIPGILPVTNFKQMSGFAAQCNASVPGWMAHLFEGLDDQPQTRQLVAATVAAEQCRQLYTAGVRDFHFYSLNRSELVYGICHMLGLRPKEMAR